MSLTAFTTDRANQFILENKEQVNPQFKPEKHFSAEVGWLNDPNGFVYFRGYYHLFYQFYPYDSAWGPMHWGHARSKDLVNWEHLPVALAPDQEFDRNGCFSGSAIVVDDRLWLMYTGHIEEEDGVRQVQNMAFSDDGLHFEKIAENPVATGAILPEEVSFRDFRDPKIFKREGRYYSVVASQHKDQVGCIVLLGSDDLIHWDFESIFLKGETHQGHVFECPDFFQLDGKDCLIVSPMRYQRDGDSFHNINSSVLFTGKVDWERKVFVPETVQEIDHGQDFYAPQTLEDEQGRRIMIAWMQTWGRTLPANDLKHAWTGVMTLPRQLRLVEGRLVQELLPDYLSEFEKVAPGDSITKASHFKVSVANSQHYRLGSEDDFITFGYDAEQSEVYLDRTHLANKITGEEAEDTSRRYVTISAHTFDVMIDKNSVEIFVNGGQETLSATVYLQGSVTLTEA